MKAAPFVYHRPGSLPEALALLAALGDDAKVLAGGQSLVPLLALRLAGPAHLVDIGGLVELGAVSPIDRGWSIGANVTQRRAELHRGLAEGVPLLTAALGLIAHPQIRNRGTVCGSLAHADPAAELPAVALALDAIVHLASVRGRRALRADEFFVSYLETALAPDEVLVGIDVPTRPARTGAAFREISRRHGDFAVAGAAVQVVLHEDGRVAELRIALSGVAPTPVRATAAEQLARGAAPDAALVAAVAAAATDHLRPSDDIHATANYRRHVAGVMVRRALLDALEHAAEGAVP